MHILLSRAKRGIFHEAPEFPPGAYYDAGTGIWWLNGTLLAQSPNMERRSKKWDIETGEDQKGQ